MDKTESSWESSDVMLQSSKHTVDSFQLDALSSLTIDKLKPKHCITFDVGLTVKVSRM